jgi:prepilin-type N-terminal cleavage/methylation domain-containing protein
MRGRHLHSGFTLLEVAIVVAVIGSMTLLALPEIGSWVARQRVRSTAHSLANILTVARTEAMRTERNHVVFFLVDSVRTTDPAGNPIADSDGIAVRVLLIDDGPEASANCHIDAGEIVMSYPFVEIPGISWGVTEATIKAPLDSTPVAISNSITFSDPDSPVSALIWVLFRPDGIPVTFSGSALNCNTVGETGSGTGAIYLTNGERDYAIVLAPLGNVRLHSWNVDTGAWTN